jgi:hypothetical protein
METSEAALMYKTTAIAVEATAAHFQKWIESGQNGHSLEFPHQNDKGNKLLPGRITGFLHFTHEQPFLPVRNTGA